MRTEPIRLAMIVTHPIQYYVPLYRRLALRNDVEIKVFFTWHGAKKKQYDPGFKRDIAWDIPLTDRYESEVVPNIARRPGSDHFWGIRTPSLVSRVMAWKPDAVHVTGYAYASHLFAMRALHKRDAAVLFRGDSHLLDQESGLRWQIKRLGLSHVYKWATVCLYVGKNNYDYFQKVGVPESKLFYCPHSIEVERFSEPNNELEAKARAWRAELRISEKAKVILFAGKFERKKQPIELMYTVAKIQDPSIVLIMVGNGELENEVHRTAAQAPERFRILPFQNQSVMPVVYRLGDVFVLPSAYGETWGLAVNEALACGRKVLISEKVGCAPDLINAEENGDVFKSENWEDCKSKLTRLLSLSSDAVELRQRAKEFAIQATESTLMSALEKTRYVGRKAFESASLKTPIAK
jgi:glycosyltransferase involved in cell wall biosynthesis